MQKFEIQFWGFVSGMSLDPCCPRCGLKEETLTHALLTCEEVRRWWFACPLAIRVEENEEIDILQWIGGSINFGVDEVTTRVFEKLYTIWRCINSLVFLF